jgi:RNA polymerase sigma-70 factor (ECF subfamily)
MAARTDHEAHPREALDAAWEKARAAWPEIALPKETFVAHLAALVPAPAGENDPFRDVHVADLYLACACGHEDPIAIRALEHDHLARMPRFIRKTSSDVAFADEVIQTLRCRLLLRDGGPSKILEYAGRGSLGAWLRVAAIRIAQTIRRGEKPQIQLANHDVVGASIDREVDALRAKLGPGATEALRDSLRGLSAEQRNLLRLHYFDGLSFERIGALFRVNRATACRWVAEARRAILEQTRRSLRERLALRESEIDALTKLLRSQIDVSISSLLESV